MGRREEQREETRAQLFDAAVGLLAERPYEEITVEEICAAAGVGRATFFRHYQAKVGLLREFNRRLTHSIEAAIADREPLSATDCFWIVQQRIAETWQHASPGLLAMALEFIGPAPGGGKPPSAHPELRRLMIAIAQRGIEAREFRSDLPAELLGASALYHLVAATAHCFRHPELPLDRTTRAALEHWLDGSRKPAATTATRGEPIPSAREDAP